MSKQTKPLLSIGMIFKNEIRCLERCLKSLEPLRQAIPCELIMVDTGSEDGSREIAERYADLVVDFPWVNDFAAARNAAMDRALGKWYLTIDSDEYLDPDISQLIQFFQTGKEALGAIIQRNYFTAEMNGDYSDSFAVRLALMSSGPRYQGRIHESFSTASRYSPATLSKTVLHHDGYVGLRGEAGKEKRERNRSLLRIELEERPEDLRALMSYIDCSRAEADCLEYIQRAVKLIEGKKAGWKEFGPPIFRYAVYHAYENHMPEMAAWADRAVKWFPNSYFTTVDVAYAALRQGWIERDYNKCVHWGEIYLKAIEDMDGGLGDQAGLVYGSLLMIAPRWRREARLLTAIAHLEVGNCKRTLELMDTLDASVLDAAQASNLAVLLGKLHKGSAMDTAALISKKYDEICRSVPSPEQRNERRAAFIQMASAAFDPAVQSSELEELDFSRLSYTAFLPLADRCDLGRGAAILATDNPQDVISFLAQVEKWNELPVSALEHALELGVPFPLESKPLTLEEMDGLAGRMSGEVIVNLAIQAVDNAVESNWQTMIWTRELTLAAIQSDCWSKVEQSMDLCRAFAKIESTTLPRYYGDEALKEENISTLPPAHRFGWYCARAFEALDAGNRKEYMHLLRLGLTSYPTMKGMVEFLAANTPEIKKTVNPSSELLSLAEQVRTLLSSFAPGDPALEAIRSSEAYQKVAYLIEGTDAGGLPS